MMKSFETVAGFDSREAGGFQSTDVETLEGCAAESPETMPPHFRENQDRSEELGAIPMDLEIASADYAALFEQAPVGYVSLDGHGRITSINQTGCALLGGDRGELIMSPIIRYVDPEFTDAFHALQQAMLAGNGGGDLRMVRRDGTKFWARLSCWHDQSGDDPQGCQAILSDISDQYLLREDLETTKAYTSSLISSMLEGFSVLDLQGVCLDVNPAFCQMTGFFKEELLGIGAPHAYWPPEYYPQIESAFESTLNGNATSVELIFMRKDGLRFPVIVSAFAVLDRKDQTVGFAATVKDNTERKRMEQHLREWNARLETTVSERIMEVRASERRLRLIASATFEGVSISENGIIIDGNDQVAAMFHTEVSEMIGRPLIDFVAPESRDLVMDRIYQNSQAAYEFIGLREDGTKIAMEAQGRIMTWQGKTLRVTALRDLTDIKAFEEKIEHQREELEQSKRLSLVGEISSGIVHQLGQPLSAVGLNLLTAMERLEAGGAGSGDMQGLLRDIDADVVRMRHCMSRLKALATFVDLVRLPMDLNALILKNLEYFQREIRSEGYSIDYAPGEEPVEVLADEVQLSQAVFNLLRNAIDACRDCPPDRRKLQITTRTIAGVGVELCVRDSGIGIAPEVMAQLFKPFFTTKQDGIGIGLRLCRTIVEAHGGKIKVCNNVDGPGSMFCVILPLVPISSEDYAKV